MSWTHTYTKNNDMLPVLRKAVYPIDKFNSYLIFNVSLDLDHDFIFLTFYLIVKWCIILLWFGDKFCVFYKLPDKQITYIHTNAFCLYWDATYFSYLFRILVEPKLWVSFNWKNKAIDATIKTKWTIFKEPRRNKYTFLMQLLTFSSHSNLTLSQT